MTNLNVDPCWSGSTALRLKISGSDRLRLRNTALNCKCRIRRSFCRIGLRRNLISYLNLHTVLSLKFPRTVFLSGAASGPYKTSFFCFDKKCYAILPSRKLLVAKCRYLYSGTGLFPGLWICIHFIRIQQFFWMRIRIQVQILLNKIWRKKIMNNFF